MRCLTVFATLAAAAVAQWDTVAQTGQMVNPFSSQSGFAPNPTAQQYPYQQQQQQQQQQFGQQQFGSFQPQAPSYPYQQFQGPQFPTSGQFAPQQQASNQQPTFQPSPTATNQQPTNQQPSQPGQQTFLPNMPGTNQQPLQPKQPLQQPNNFNFGPNQLPQQPNQPTGPQPNLFNFGDNQLSNQQNLGQQPNQQTFGSNWQPPTQSFGFNPMFGNNPSPNQPLNFEPLPTQMGGNLPPCQPVDQLPPPNLDNKNHIPFRYVLDQEKLTCGEVCNKPLEEKRRIYHLAEEPLRDFSSAEAPSLDRKNPNKAIEYLILSNGTVRIRVSGIVEIEHLAKEPLRDFSSAEAPTLDRKNPNKAIEYLILSNSTVRIRNLYSSNGDFSKWDNFKLDEKPYTRIQPKLLKKEVLEDFAVTLEGEVSSYVAKCEAKVNEIRAIAVQKKKDLVAAQRRNRNYNRYG